MASTAPLVFLLLLAACQAQVLLRKRDVTVNVGRDVYLRNDDLVFRRTRRGEECRVEVMTTDPVTQRVGHVHPEIFDCDFPDNTVKYVHNGSPLLSSDEVKMRVHKFTDTDTITQTFYLNVQIVNASHEIVITRGLRPVVVPEFNGLSNTIDASALRFRHSGNPNASCTVSFSKYHTHWPVAGQMVMGNRRQTVDSVKKSCREFLFMNLHYEHLRSPTPDVDYLPLTVEVYEPGVSEEVLAERFYLPVYIKGALPNSPPRASFMSMYMMDVDQFVLSTIIPGVISAEDYETPKSQLVFNISKPFGPGKGFLVSLDDHATPITSFLQDDLENHRIAYRPPNTSHTERRVHEVEFTVFDSHFARSMPIVLHVAVRPSATSAPRVSHNTGLVLLEGQSRRITTQHLQVTDKDNPENVRFYVAQAPHHGYLEVRFYVKGGVGHGSLTVGGRQTIVFTPEDVAQGRVLYTHDDSDSTRDRVDLRITDGLNTVLASFPISIVPKDDTPPYLVNNLGLTIDQGDMQKISDVLLLAQDTDSLDSNIIYTLVQGPRSGDLVRRVRPSDTGTKIFGFRQRDLVKGQVYYRHDGSQTRRDSFQFKLQDQQVPPNESEVQTFDILITPTNENPPRLSPEASRLIYVPETDIAYISQAELHYTDHESNPSELVYRVTTPPYFVYNTGEGDTDAGRLISTHNLTMVMKDPTIQPLTRFTQRDVNHMKIAYMPPVEDIGPESRLVRFLFSVEDSSGNKVYGQIFDIEVLPVNNRVPEFAAEKLLVEEGGVLGITIQQLSARDPDTPSEDLSFLCDVLPRYGTLQKAGLALGQGDVFTLEDLRRKDIRYVHDGSEEALDTMTLTLTDGKNQASKVLSIDIVPIDDQTPQLENNLRPFLIVNEGGEAVVTARSLAAKDDDTDEDSLIFLIIRQPNYGVLQLEGQPVTKFTQKDVKDEKVSFLHTSGEIGMEPLSDMVTFIVSDQTYLASADLPMYDLNITITPVNNQAPAIVLGAPILVAESETFRLSPEVLSVSDPDSDVSQVEFRINSQPQWGYLENTAPREGSERSRAGERINSFSYQRLLDGSINYVQAMHKGVEPVQDAVELYATDGKLSSQPQLIKITIVPANDEVPDLMLKDFEIAEGGSMIIDQSMVDAIDLDMPKDTLILSVSQRPQHGDVMMMIHTKKGEVETPVQDFSIDELHSGMHLKYQHDGTESLHDKFAVTVSDGKHEIKKVCSVRVKPKNDERPEIIKNAGLQLEYGGSALISSLVLQATDQDNGDNDLYYIVSRLPQKGSLQFCPDPFSPNLALQCRDVALGSNFTQRDVDLNKVRYVHTTSMGNTETDHFRFVLTDGAYKRHEETFEIRVLNSKKSNIALLNRGMTVREGERIAVSTANLSASDESTKAEEIVFAVIRPPRLGQLEYIDRPFVSISSFTQLDLASQKVVYNHLTKNDITVDSFTFTVTNGLSEAKDGEFRITIQPLDRVLPSLVTNNLIEVLQGSSVRITPHHLKVTDPDTAANHLSFKVAKPPTYGRLYNRGVLVTQAFTQNDLEHGFISYKSDGSKAGLDNFLFTVEDGRHEGYLVNGSLKTNPAMLSVFIKPLVEDAPKLIVNRRPDTLEHFGKQRYGYKLSSQVLRSVDSDTPSRALLFIMTEKPQAGHLENTATKRYVNRKFTQKDLDDNHLRYVIDRKSEATNDSFRFRVEDLRGNTLEDQIFEMSWSRVEFEQDDLVACENVGTLAVAVRRSGALDQSAFVGLQVRDMSARAGEDFTPSSSKQIQFDPGESRVTWDLHIKQDGVEESNEKFRLMLNTPFNAILGDKRKLRARIIDAVNGECPQYLGMISRPSDHLTLDKAPGAPIPTHLDGQVRDTVVAYRGHVLATATTTENRLPLNTEPKAVPVAPPSKPRGRGRKRKGRKGKGKGKRKGKGRRNSAKAKKDNSSPAKPSTDLTGVLPTPSKINAPQKCTTSTKGLLHFDTYEQQMFKCDGQQWRLWSAISNNDESVRSPASGSICLPGWLENSGRCYLVLKDRLSWDDGEKLCFNTHKAHLPSVLSLKHLKWLGEQAAKKSFWLGLNDKRQTGVWTYMSGDVLGFTNWKNGRARVKRRLHKKNCVVVKKKLKWRNKHCDRPKAKVICELNPQPLQSTPAPPRFSMRRRRGPSRRHTSRSSRRSRNERSHGETGFFFGK